MFRIIPSADRDVFMVKRGFMFADVFSKRRSSSMRADYQHVVRSGGGLSVLK